VAVIRQGASLGPEAAGPLAPRDWIYLLAREADSALLGELLTAAAAPPYLEKRRFYGDFMVHGDARMGALAEQYGLPLTDGEGSQTLEDFLTHRLSGPPVAGDRCRLGNVEFVVRAVEAGHITRVGLRIPAHLR
jgi:cell volume regulation protein A